ncbi:TolC family protein [Chitinophagaceae bacterium 26-R-25]|nr:TolC family protein [Chitinophagaceae bacterium 26-R-25]
MHKSIITVTLILLFYHVAVAQTKTLDDYLSQALNNSPLLKDYRGQIASGAVDSALIRATYKPQVNGNSYNSYSPTIKGWGYDYAITNGANVNALVGVNKALVSQRYLQAQLETVSLQNKGIENTSKISEQDLKRTIIAQYITAYGDLEQLAFTKEILSLLTREDTLLKLLTQKNVYRQTDYLTFLVTRQQQELVVQQQLLQYKTDLATLNYLSGLVDTSTIFLAIPAIAMEALPGADKSVFFNQYTIDSLKLTNQKNVLDFSYKPKVNLFADAGYNSSLAETPYKNFGTSFGFNITVPIYDGQQRKLKYKKIDIAERTRSQYKDFFTSQYNQQIIQLLQQLKNTQALIDQINNQVKYSEGLIQVNEKLLSTGDVRIADLVIAFNNYLISKNLLTQNKVSRLQIINQINYWNR